MPSTRKQTTKDGTTFYEIRVSQGRGRPYLTSRWYPPAGWSQKAISKELTKQAAEFERKVKSGEAVSRADRKEAERQAQMEADKVMSLQAYSERVFMPTLTVRASENTRTTYQMNLDHWIIPAIGALKMPDITAANVTALLLSMQAQGKSQATCVKVYTILHSLFKMAYMTDVIPKNPMDKVERPKARKGERQGQEIEAYTVEEIQTILNALDKEPIKWQAFIRLLIDTGIRRGEACGLRWKDVDFQNDRITIAGNLCYTPEKGVYLDTPKNGRTRSVDVDPDVMRLLWTLRASQHVVSQFVFAQDNGDPIHPQSPTRYFKKFGERYGVADFHPHKLRHSFASIAITNGADVASVSEKLGHSDKAVTLRMYTHADQESIKRAGNIFREAIKKQA